MIILLTSAVPSKYLVEGLDWIERKLLKLLMTTT